MIVNMIITFKKSYASANGFYIFRQYTYIVFILQC